MENKTRSILHYILWVVVIVFISLEALNKTLPDTDRTLKIIIIGSIILVGTYYFRGNDIMRWIHDKMNSQK